MNHRYGVCRSQSEYSRHLFSLYRACAPKDKKDIIATGKGNQLFYLRSTGQWFYSDRHGVELAEIKCQKDISEMQKNGFEEFYLVENVLENLGISEKTEIGEYMGWDISEFQGGREFRFVISSDWMDLPWGKEVVGIVNFATWPTNI